MVEPGSQFQNETYDGNSNSSFSSKFRNFILDGNIRPILGTNSHLSDNKILRSWQYMLFMLTYCLICSFIGIFSVTFLPDPNTLEALRNENQPADYDEIAQAASYNFYDAYNDATFDVSNHIDGVRSGDREGRFEPLKLRSGDREGHFQPLKLRSGDREGRFGPLKLRSGDREGQFEPLQLRNKEKRLSRSTSSRRKNPSLSTGMYDGFPVEKRGEIAENNPFPLGRRGKSRRYPPFFMERRNQNQNSRYNSFQNSMAGQNNGFSTPNYGRNGDSNHRKYVENQNTSGLMNTSSYSQFNNDENNYENVTEVIENNENSAYSVNGTTTVAPENGKENEKEEEDEDLIPNYGFLENSLYAKYLEFYYKHKEYIEEKFGYLKKNKNEDEEEEEEKEEKKEEETDENGYTERPIKENSNNNSSSKNPSPFPHIFRKKPTHLILIPHQYAPVNSNGTYQTPALNIHQPQPYRSQFHHQSQLDAPQLSAQNSGPNSNNRPKRPFVNVRTEHDFRASRTESSYVSYEGEIRAEV